MSTRNIRKLAAKLQPKEPVEEHEEEFEPVYSGGNFTAYRGLVVSSSSNSEAEESSNSDSEESTPIPVSSKSKKKNNRKNRKKNKIKGGNNNAAPESFGANTPADDALDEIERSVLEVNQLLGEPEEAPASTAQPAQVESSTLLKVDHKHLNVNNELTRLFGPDDNEDRRRRKPRHNPRLLRRQIVLPNESYNFTCKGYSMTLLDVQDGVKYFKFAHGVEYQRNMRMLVRALKLHYDDYTVREEPEVYPPNTVEALIENLDLYFNLDEHNLATTSLEQAIYFMQSVADPSFSFTDGKTRLEYKYVENRTFHVALLKYLHILTNKACHRSALELAKLMINLDPSDPLGVIFIVDTLALRAREHQWLVDIYDQWKDDKDAARLFHMRYSLALSMFHVAKRSKSAEDEKTADSLMKLALVKYPTVALMLVDFCSQRHEGMMSHEVFTTLASKTTSADLKSLMHLYAKFAWPKWREPNVMEWVIKNADELLNQFKNDPAILEQAHTVAKERQCLFRKFPLEIRRHLNTIRSMSDLLVEGVVPQVERTISFNPYPASGRCVDMCQYYKEWGVRYPGDTVSSSVVRSFIASLAPDSHQGGSARRDIITLSAGTAAPAPAPDIASYPGEIAEPIRQPESIGRSRRNSTSSDTYQHYRRFIEKRDNRPRKKNKRHVREQAARAYRHG